MIMIGSFIQDIGTATAMLYFLAVPRHTAMLPVHRSHSPSTDLLSTSLAMQTTIITLSMSLSMEKQ
jgi:hypothetical protein